MSDAISAWAVDKSEESDVDLSVSMTPGIDLSLLLRTLVLSCTLSMRSFTSPCSWSLNRFS